MCYMLYDVTTLYRIIRGNKTKKKKTNVESLTFKEYELIFFYLCVCY